MSGSTRRSTPRSRDCPIRCQPRRAAGPRSTGGAGWRRSPRPSRPSTQTSPRDARRNRVSGATDADHAIRSARCRAALAKHLIDSGTLRGDRRAGIAPSACGRRRVHGSCPGHRRETAAARSPYWAVCITPAVGPPENGSNPRAPRRPHPDLTDDVPRRRPPPGGICARRGAGGSADAARIREAATPCALRSRYDYRSRHALASGPRGRHGRSQPQKTLESLRGSSRRLACRARIRASRTSRDTTRSPRSSFGTDQEGPRRWQPR